MKTCDMINETLLDLTTPKGRILHASLKLFAKAGFHAVSVRDIAREVGIKDASIYSHFSSKDEILETIITRFRIAFTSSIPDVTEFEYIFKRWDVRSFLLKGFTLFQKRLEDPATAWTYFVLTREKFDNGRAAEAWEAHRKMVIAYITEAFTVMMRLGMIIKSDAAALARLYEYPHFLFIEEYVHNICEQKQTSHITAEIRSHVKFFVTLIEIKQEEK